MENKKAENKFYVITEKELLELGVKPKEQDRIFQWYGITELEADLHSAENRGECIEAMLELGIVDVRADTWDDLFDDAMYDIKEYIKNKNMEKDNEKI